MYARLSWVWYFVLGFHTLAGYSPFIMSPRKQIRKPDYLKTQDVAEILGISQRTLLRKLANGAFPEPSRNPSNNYRRWRPEDVQAVRQVHERETA